MTSRRKRWAAHLAAALAVLIAVLAPTPAAFAADPGQISPCPYSEGTYWCRIMVKDVTSTRFGTGKHVYVAGNVVAVTATSVTISEMHATMPPCPPGNLCGQTLDISFEYLTVKVPSWSGGRRPPLYTLVRLYGTTTQGSIKIVGFTSSVACGPLWELC